MTRSCGWCDEVLGAKQGLYCSIACYAAMRRLKPTTTCLGCGQAFAAHRHGVHRRQKYCSLGCSRRRYRQTILDVLRATQHREIPWLTLADLSTWVYGDARRSQIHAARTQLFRLRRCGYTFEHRDMALMGYRGWVRVYRLVGEPEG